MITMVKENVIAIRVSKTTKEKLKELKEQWGGDYDSVIRRLIMTHK